MTHPYNRTFDENAKKACDRVVSASFGLCTVAGTIGYGAAFTRVLTVESNGQWVRMTFGGPFLPVLLWAFATAVMLTLAMRAYPKSDDGPLIP